MDLREIGSHVRGKYPTQYTSRMKTARVRREEEADTRIILTLRPHRAPPVVDLQQ